MKYLLLSLTLLAAPSSFAADPAMHSPVEVPLIGLKVVIDDGRAIATWKRYKRDDFSSYRLVKSDTDEAPVFPATKEIYKTNFAADTQFEDNALAAGTWHYRLCIVTLYGQRWVSPVVTVVIAPDQVRRPVPTAADFEP